MRATLPCAILIRPQLQYFDCENDHFRETECFRHNIHIMLSLFKVTVNIFVTLLTFFYEYLLTYFSIVSICPIFAYFAIIFGENAQMIFAKVIVKIP